MGLPDKLNAKQKAIVEKYKSEGLDELFADKMEAAVWAVASPNQKESSKAEAYDAAVREAQGVLQSLYVPRSIVSRQCKECKRVFGTNYQYDKYCSDTCRKESLERLGLKWDPTKPARERWQAEPPTTISAETMQILRSWAEQILAMPTDIPVIPVPESEWKPMEVEFYPPQKEHKELLFDELILEDFDSIG